MADSGEDGVGSIACTAFEIVAPEVAVIFHVPDYRFDGRAPPQFVFDGTNHATCTPSAQVGPF